LPARSLIPANAGTATAALKQVVEFRILRMTHHEHRLLFEGVFKMLKGAPLIVVVFSRIAPPKIVAHPIKEKISGNLRFLASNLTHGVGFVRR
jgi:hypothetical protein